QSRPTRPLEDVVAGTLDAAIVWGPWAGYFAKQSTVALEVVPIDGSGPIPLGFDISMGVKKGERELKTELEEALARRQADIAKILDDFGVPRLPVSSAGAAPPSQAPVAPSLPAGPKFQQ